jgi:hypothetical protein
MTVSTRMFGGFLVLGIAALWSASADAAMCAGQPASCPCGTSTQQTCTYSPARYVGAAAGDVALVNEIGSASAVQAFLNAMKTAFSPNLTYMHTKINYDASGQRFTETFPAEMPPTSHDTGEDFCSRPISAFYLERLSPGTGVYSDTTAGATYSVNNTANGIFYEDAQAGAIVKNFGTHGCTVPQQSYNINSYLHDDVTGGSCEKLLVDRCAVPVENNTYLGCFADEATRDLPVWAINNGAVTVESCIATCAAAGYTYAAMQDSSYCFCGSSYGRYGAASNCNMACSANGGEICGGGYANSVYKAIGGDRPVYNNATYVNVAEAVWTAAYNACQDIQSSLSPFMQLEEHIGCGGVTAAQICGRMAWQVVNAISSKAYPMESTCPPGTCYATEWSDFLTMGTPPPVNGPYPPPYYNTWSGIELGASKTNFQAIANGVACQANNANGPAIACSGWGPTSFTANMPDNILRAAQRLGAAVQSVSPGAGITAGSTSCTSCQVCANTKSCDSD